MDNAIYATLSRQSGLMQEMRTVANNIANISTSGFRREGVIFSEHVAALDGDAPSLSMAYAHGRNINDAQGPLSQTGGAFDFAIEGEGYFQIETPQGNQLSRAGSFTPSAEGELEHARRLSPAGCRGHANFSCRPTGAGVNGAGRHLVGQWQADRAGRGLYARRSKRVGTYRRHPVHG